MFYIKLAHILCEPLCHRLCDTESVIRDLLYSFSFSSIKLAKVSLRVKKMH